MFPIKNDLANVKIDKTSERIDRKRNNEVCKKSKSIFIGCFGNLFGNGCLPMKQNYPCDEKINQGVNPL